MLPEALLALKQNVPNFFGYLQELGYSPFICEEDKISDLVKLLGARSILFSFINREKTLLIEFQFIKFPDEERVVSAATILNLKNKGNFTLEDYVKFKGLPDLPDSKIEDVLSSYQGLLTNQLLPIVLGKAWEDVPFDLCDYK